MIEKVIAIRSIGRFLNCTGQGDTQFRRLTLVYGENGRGKTTLCDILRSLVVGDGSIITGRIALGAVDKPLVQIRANGATLGFKDGKWDSSLSDVLIFDKTFIHDNVFAGDLIEHEHKKNLYRVIVGEQGTTLAREVEKLDADIRQINKDIASTKGALDAVVPKSLKLESFLALESLDNAEVAITTQEAEVAAQSRADEIKAKGLLQAITLPTLPNDFESILTKTLDDLSHQAEESVRNHIAAHLNVSGEKWLGEGLEFAPAGENCPFCGQSIAGLDLISAYRAFFGDGYSGLKQSVADLKQRVSQSLGEAVSLAVQRTIGANATLIEFWKQFIAVPAAPDLAFDADIRPVLIALRDAATTLVETKAASLLEPCDVTATLQASLDRCAALSKQVAAYNDFVATTNASVEAKKKSTGAGNAQAARDTLAMMKARKTRFESPTKDNCVRYVEQQARKKTLETEKEKAKKSLDEFGATVCVEYQQRINELLDRFHAGFRICNTNRSYIGGTASTSYQIEINNVAVELGDDKTPISTHSFRNTLSSGDRSTLAFAFFVAQVERDPRLNQKIVVFDDPFTSQDRSRRSCTQQIINRLATQSKQVIVLSHDASFLRDVWDGDYTQDVKTLQFVRLRNSTVLSEWNIEDETMGEYHRMHSLLSLYFNEGRGDKRHVAQTIRPFLEHWLKFKFPGQVKDGEMLGTFLSSVRDADQSDPIAAAKAILDDLEDINGYSKKYHHAFNPQASSEPIDDTELQGFVKRTLHTTV